MSEFRLVHCDDSSFAKAGENFANKLESSLSNSGDSKQQEDKK